MGRRTDLNEPINKNPFYDKNPAHAPTRSIIPRLRLGGDTFAHDPADRHRHRSAESFQHLPSLVFKWTNDAGSPTERALGAHARHWRTSVHHRAGSARHRPRPSPRDERRPAAPHRSVAGLEMGWCRHRQLRGQEKIPIPPLVGLHPRHHHRRRSGFRRKIPRRRHQHPSERKPESRRKRAGGCRNHPYHFWQEKPQPGIRLGGV